MRAGHALRFEEWARDSRGNDMRDWLKALAGCKDVASLRSTVHELCTGLGEISHFDVLTLSRSGKHQALCFLRLESAAQEQQLMANLGVTRFGNELLFVVDLPTEQANVAERPQDPDHDQISRDAAAQRPRHDRNENAGDKQFWFNPARWSATLPVVARRVLDREIGWPNKRFVR
jgi:hypothetical protein